MTTLGHLILKFVLLVVLTFLFVVLFDNGPNDYVSALQSHLTELTSARPKR